MHIPIINDKCLEEKEEMFNVTLSTEEECVEFTVDCTTVTIQDDDRELQPQSEILLKREAVVTYSCPELVGEFNALFSLPSL